MRSTIVVVLVLLLASTVQAEIPQVISYQGKVTDASGAPIADGTYMMQFRIYDAVSAGTLQWDSGDVSVTVAGGVFSILLGESPQPALTLDFSADYWLEVTVGGDAQSPRVKMGSAGYAYMASGLVAGTEVVGAVNTGTLAAIKGTNTATTGFADGLYGVSSSPYGHGVFGLNFSTGGSGVYGEAHATTGLTYGVHGRSDSPWGCGVCGEATATVGAGGDIAGVRGVVASPDGCGVYGEATHVSGSTSGVSGVSSSSTGNGVSGYASATAGATHGVYGYSSSTEGYGVYGRTTVTMGVTHGVYGWSASTGGRGVAGYVYAPTGATYGVRGESRSTEGCGVYGVATADEGPTYGGYFETWSTGGDGVYGRAWATTGGSIAVYGRNDSNAGMGIYGSARATTGTNYGVYGRTYSASGYGVYYNGGLAGSGTKSCVVRTSKGPTLLYCLESPENWFEDVGRGRLTAGSAHVELDPVFLETVTIDVAHPMEVFVQLRDDCRGVFVKAGTTGFDVRELQGGTSDAEFSYRVMAKRQGFETKRLDVCEAARTDSYLYPELRDKEEHEASGVRSEAGERAQHEAGRAEREAAEPKR